MFKSIFEIATACLIADYIYDGTARKHLTYLRDEATIIAAQLRARAVRS